MVTQGDCDRAHSLHALLYVDWRRDVKRASPMECGRVPAWRVRRRFGFKPHGLDLWRWPIERTLSCLHQFRRLRIGYERRPDLHEASLQPGCAWICWNFLM